MSVAKEIGKGTLYNALAKYIGIAVNLLVTGILARILAPEEFGTVALTMVFIIFFDLLGNMGLGPAIIQNKLLDNRDLASIFNLSVIIAGVLGVSCIGTSTLVTSFYDGNAILSNIMKLLSIQVFFTILSVVPYSLLLKKKQFKLIAVTSVSCRLLYGALAILSAMIGLGIYSLLIAPIGTSITLFFVYTICSRKLCGAYHTFILKLESIKKVLSFSVYQFLFNIVNYFSRNLDKILIGNQFSMSDLGYYEKSYHLMQLPISNISSVMAPTIQPVLSQYQDDKEKMATYTTSIFRMLAYIGCVLTPFLYFCSREIIMIVFGSNWEPAVPIFQILSISVFAQIVDSASGSLLQASNSPKLLFTSGLVCAALNVGAIVLGVFAFHSLIALSWILNIAFILNLVIDLYFIYCRSLNRNLKLAFQLFKHPIAIASIVTITMIGLTLVPLQNVFVRFVMFFAIIVCEALAYGQKVGLFDIRSLIKFMK